MRILLVEDDKLLGAGVEAGLRQAGFVVDWAHDGEAARQALGLEPFDGVVLDLGLPHIGGLAVLRWLRSTGNRVPVLILTAADSVSSRVAGLDAGADDYLTKPFALAELQARVRALLRRSKGVADPVLEHGRVRLDPAARSVTLDGAPVELSAREFDTLHLLLLDAGRVLSRSRLEEKLYGWGDEIESNAVEVYVHRLRKKLYPELIQTVRGVGYLIPKNAG